MTDAEAKALKVRDRVTWSPDDTIGDVVLVGAIGIEIRWDDGRQWYRYGDERLKNIRPKQGKLSL